MTLVSVIARAGFNAHTAFGTRPTVHEALSMQDSGDNPTAHVPPGTVSATESSRGLPVTGPGACGRQGVNSLGPSYPLHVGGPAFCVSVRHLALSSSAKSLSLHPHRLAT